MTWTEVPAPDGRRCWVGAWDDEGCVVLEHDPEWTWPWWSTSTIVWKQSSGKTPREALDGIGCDLPMPDDAPTPEPTRFAVGDWVTLDSMTTALVVSAVGYLRVYGEGGPSDALPEQVTGTTTRPDARWAIALDPEPGQVVVDDRGREWLRMVATAGWWQEVQPGTLADSGIVGLGSQGTIATLPDTLRGLDRLNAASDVLDGRLDALPDGVEVTPEWRQRCADVARVGTVPDDWDDDRPVMAWWGPVDGGCYRWGLSTDPHGVVRTMRSQDPHPARYAEAMGWRAVEVDDG